MSAEDLQKILDSHQSNLIQAVLSSPVGKTDCQKMTLRPIQTKQGLYYQVSEHRGPKVIHQNIRPEELAPFVCPKLGQEFRQGVFYTSGADYHVLISQKQKMTILKKKPSKTLALMPHNRPKQYLLPEGKPIDFLVHLGVMNAEGKVKAQRQDKFRQINRFLEIVDDVIDRLPKDRPLLIIDFGCGKSYLTFALYYYLHQIKKLSIDITGLDLKEDVVHFCQQVAEQLHYSHLHFRVGDINAIKSTGQVDMVVSLHACDIATDAALEKAVRWDAGIILAVPCCQHELYKQVRSESLSPLLKHGILKERFAALATDAARAQLSELLGYQTQVLEFIDMEHTPKNLLIRAVKARGHSNLKRHAEEYLAYKKALHIMPSLEMRFRQELAPWLGTSDA